MELSVILPAYNAEKTLKATLSSLAGQTFRGAWEVIAVNDGSGDRTAAVLEEAAREFPVPLRVFSQENAGPGAARNRGLFAAEGAYVAFLDADDLFLPHALEKALSVAREKEADVVVFDSQSVAADGTKKPFPAADHPGGEMSPRDFLFAEPAPWNKLVSRKIFVDNPLRFPEGVLYEDLAMIPALGAFAGRVWYRKEVLHQYRLTEGSITRSAWNEKRLDVLPALDHLIRLVPQLREEAEVLAFRHLYGTFAWQAWAAGDRDAIRRINAFVKEKFPHWEKDHLIQEEPLKRRVAASLFYRERFGILRLLKGGAL